MIHHYAFRILDGDEENTLSSELQKWEQNITSSPVSSDHNDMVLHTQTVNYADTKSNTHTEDSIQCGVLPILPAGVIAS